MHTRAVVIEAPERLILGDLAALPDGDGPQRLDADRPACRQVDLGLKVEVDLVFLERIAILAKAKCFEPFPHITHRNDSSANKAVRRASEIHPVAERLLCFFGPD